MSDVSKTNKELIEEARRLARLTVARNCGDGGITSYEDGLREMSKRLADALEAATRERAAVPDAATEEHGNRIVKSLREAVRGERAGTTIPVPVEDCREIISWRSERDAAIAAVERVRAIHVEREHRTLDGAYLGGAVCDGCRRPWPCPTVAALDGAPEPEEKP